MNRRDTVIALLALGVAPFAVEAFPALAQQLPRARQIGYFSLANVQGSTDWLASFREGMTALRWVEGRDYVINVRYANGATQAGHGLAAELVATHPELLLTPSDVGVRLLSQSTKTIPIVFAIAIDPVGNGFASNLQRPGGSVTGLTTMARDLGARRLQLLKEAFPRVAHVVLLFDPADVGSFAQVKEIEEAATRLKMSVTPIELRQATDIETAFNRGASVGANAFMVAQGFTITSYRQAIVDRSLRSKVPVMFTGNEFVEAGGLMSFSPSFRDNFRRAATYVDKILKGANPGDLPIEQPINFELVLNLKTAKAMGISFSQSILVRADRVIE